MIRIILVLIEIMLCFLLQSTVMPAVSLAGVVPDLLLVLVVSIAYMRGSMAGMLTGMLAGLLTDVCFNNVVGVCAFFYLSIGFLAGFANAIYDERNFLIPAGLITVGEFLYSFLYYIAYFLLRSRTEFGFYMFRLIVPRMVYTVFAAVIFYPLLLCLHRLLLRLEKKEE